MGAVDRDNPMVIACTLDADSAGDRVGEWRRALGRVQSRSAIPDGVRLELAADAPVGDVARLMAAEHDCCRFFSFALTVDDRGIALEVTAPPDGQAVLTSLFAA
jgi:MerR family transcriptional regulator, copper efflux regulator